MRVLLLTALLLIAPAPAFAGDWSASMPVTPVTKFTQGGQVLVANARGDALIAWERNQQVQAVVAPGGGPFARPARLGRGSRVQAAINASGESVVAWVGNGRTLQGVVAGRPFSVPFAECSLDLAGAGISDAGTTTLLWQDCDTLYAADAARGAGLAPRVTIPNPSGERPQRPAVGFGADGSVVAVWPGYQGLYTAIRTPDGVWHASVLATPRPETGVNLAVNAAGVAVVTLGGIAHIKPAGATAFGEPVATGAEIHDAAIDAAGRVTLLAAAERRTVAIPLDAPTQTVFPFEIESGRLVHDHAGTLFVAANANEQVYGAVRTATGFKRTRLAPKASSYPLSLAARGPAGAVAAWPFGLGPPTNAKVMATATWRATPLIAFAGTRVRVRAPVTATVRLLRGKKVVSRYKRK